MTHPEVKLASILIAKHVRDVSVAKMTRIVDLWSFFLYLPGKSRTVLRLERKKCVASNQERGVGLTLSSTH